MSLYRTVIGVDVGMKGAIAALGTKLAMPMVWDMPCAERGVDMDGLKSILGQFNPHDTLAYLENNTARPGEVPDFAFRFGLQTGQLWGTLWTGGFTLRPIAPQKWKGQLGLPGKTHANAVEICAAYFDEKFPAFKHLIRGPRGGLLDGRIDALCIAYYGWLGETSPCGHMGGKRPIRRILE